MTFTLTIDCTNAAFEDDPAYEVRRILAKLAIGENGVREDNADGIVRDLNGNRVGEWRLG